MGKNQTRKQQKGGVISIGDNPLKTFLDFVEGSTIDYLSVGTTGLVFTCENNERSDYYAFRPNNLATNVTKIILKLFIIHDQTQLRTKIDDLDFKSTSEFEFRIETDNQNDIVNATCEYFEPSMPTILLANITDEIDIEDVFKLSNEETDAVFSTFNTALHSLPGLKLGIIAMEHAGINETFQTMREFVDSGINDKTRKQTEAMAMYELIVMGVKGFYHGDHHRSNLLYSDNSTTDYFLSDDGSPKWYTEKRVLPIDAGRVSRLDRTFLSGHKEQNVFNHFVKTFRTTGNPDVLRRIIQMIMDGGFNYDHQQNLKNHEVYAWFNKSGEELNEIAGYIHELMVARIKSVNRVVERTIATVSDNFGGTADMNIIKQFILAELQKQKIQRIQVVTLDIIRRQLSKKVIEHIRTLVPDEITERVARLQEKLDQGKKRGGKKLGGKKKMVGGENDEFLKFIEPIDLNDLVQASCFAIIFATYLTGKFNEVEPSFMTLTMGFYKQPAFAREKQEHLFEKTPSLVSVSAGGKRKTRRKQKGGVIATRSGRELSGRELNGRELNGRPARKEREPAKQLPDPCPICLSKLSGKIIRCPNGHGFHEYCIRPWCLGRIPCPCPICRADVIIPQIQAPAPAIIDPLQAQGIYAPGQGGQEITGQGFPYGFRFTLLPPAEPNSAETLDEHRRWPLNYRPTPQEISNWGIQMSHYWWTYPGNLPLGWYIFRRNPVIEHNGGLYNDPYYRGNSTTVYPEESYQEDLADAPNWMTIPNPPPPSPPPSPPPQEGCSIM
jgi:hypothetical protein